MYTNLTDHQVKNKKSEWDLEKLMILIIGNLLNNIIYKGKIHLEIKDTLQIYNQIL